MYLAMGYCIEERCLPNAVRVVDRGTFRRVVIGIQCNIRERKYDMTSQSHQGRCST